MNIHQPICNNQEYNSHFQQIDEVISRIEKYKEGALDVEINNRNNAKPDFALSDNAILKKLIHMIAYSQQAKASRVTDLINNGIFDTIFGNYDIQTIALLKPQDIIDKQWSNISAIRFRDKVHLIINTAQSLQNLLKLKTRKSFMDYFSDKKIPLIIMTEEQFDSFWEKFNSVQQDLKEVNMPFFKNFTSLCHLFLDIGFDCAKPDSAVMGAAVKLGIIPPPKKQTNNPDKVLPYPRRHLEKVIKTIQVYGLCRNKRPAVIDLYFLIHGRQSGIKHMVKKSYY